MPKSYSQYRYEDIYALGLDLNLSDSLLRDTKPVQPSDLLNQILAAYTKQVLSTEKAKSEFIIAPILFEIAQKNQAKVSFFSGHNLDVDKDLGLKGFCDFIYSRTPQAMVIKEPIFCIAEAKNDDLEKGIPQCVAEMYAAQLFNQNHKRTVQMIHGCVTTGYQWQFLRLEGQSVQRDLNIYSLAQLPTILGILQHIIDAV